MHVTLTDLLDSHIGNSEKIKILNRLGAVASSDTHARYRHTIVQETKEKGNKHLREKSVVLSIDNIDYLQSHAAVYSGDQHRSWHGTTIQALASNKTQGETPTSAHPAVSCSRPTPSLGKLASLPPVRQTPSLGSTAGPCSPSLDNKAGPLPARPTPSLGNRAPPSLAGPPPARPTPSLGSTAGPPPTRSTPTPVEGASLRTTSIVQGDSLRTPSIPEAASLRATSPVVSGPSHLLKLLVSGFLPWIVA